MLRLIVLVSLPALAATEEELWSKAKGAASAFQKETGVPVLWLEGNPAKGQEVGDGIVAYPPTALDAASSIDPLMNELSIYPPAFLKRSGLSRIVVARGLERQGKPWGGFAMHRGPKKGTLFVSLANLQWAAMAIHHEVFHLTQHTSELEARLPEFLACNPSGFGYASDGPIDPSKPRTSTLTEYARTNPEEDEAETFAWTVSDAAFAAQQSRQDAAIACKVKVVKAFVQAIDERFDDERWSKLAKRRAGDRLP